MIFLHSSSWRADALNPELQKQVEQAMGGGAVGGVSPPVNLGTARF